jgi:transposase
LEDDRDRIAVLNIEKRGLEVLGISGGPLTTPTAPQMTDVGPSRLRNRTALNEPSPFMTRRRSAWTL